MQLKSKWCGIVLTAITLASAGALAQVPDWTQMHPTGALPSPRVKPAMAQLGDRVVMFGGGNSTETTPLGDTWIWDGASWSQVTTFGLFGTGFKPNPRIGGSMTFDPDTGQAVLFGGLGSDGELLGDTWVFSFVTNQLLHRSWYEWDQLETTTRPAPRANASMEYDPVSKTIILMDGDAETGAHLDAFKIQDTWSLTLGSAPAWVPVNINNDTLQPPPRSRAMLAKCGSAFSCSIVNGRLSCPIVPAPDQLLGFGGLRNGTNGAPLFLGDTWSLQGTLGSFVWSQVTTTPSPPARSGAGMAYYPVSATAVLYGGTSNGIIGNFSDTWSANCLFNSAPAWSQLAPAHNPGLRVSHGMTTGPDGLSLVVFGGIAGGIGTANDTWTWGRSVACAPGGDNQVAAGSEIKCLFTPAEGVRFQGWRAEGFEPCDQREAAATFRARGRGQASITARWRDQAGEHETTLEYEVLGRRHHGD
jgi:Galactose oxidase, central domain